MAKIFDLVLSLTDRRLVGVGKTTFYSTQFKAFIGTSYSNRKKYLYICNPINEENIAKLNVKDVSQLIEWLQDYVKQK